ncbi:MAG: SRPBCC family protein [Chloroflexi bacterium]|nr:SRPBCC family protein [Chloroflexota bacterium]
MSNLIEQMVIFKASPHEVYEALMDSGKHSAFTKSVALISAEMGAEYSAYDGYITGKNLELVPDAKIVQSWRAVDWPEDHFSVVTFLFTPVGAGTRLDFTQTNLPPGTEEEFIQGWIDNYWEPMKVFLEN